MSKRRNPGDAFFNALVVIAIAGLIAFSFWAWFAGPCWLYTFAVTGDTPARCVMR